MTSESATASHRATRRRVLQGVLASLAGLGSAGSGRAAANQLRVGSRAPTATLTTLDGEIISTPELLGKVVVLTFWATWCTPCRTELPLLSSYAAAHAERGLQVLGFSLDGIERKTEVRAVARTLSFPVGLLTASQAPGYGRIWRLPVSFTIDRRGCLANDGWKERAPAWSAERLEQIVTPLLA
jgi:cytochrome c biogenesis protein CcmG, thiol:disulfide interchange protein DsbE